MSKSSEDKMSEAVLRIATTLTSWEAASSGLKWHDARAVVARKAGIFPGSLERLERGTLKFVDRIGHKLDDLFIAAAKRKIAAIEHEVKLARARGDECEIDLSVVVDALEKARRALDRRPQAGDVG